MRFREFQGGIQMPVSLEEEALIKKIDDSKEGITEKDELDERELELARKMVSRGLLNRFRTNEKTFYMVNKLEDVWRS
jgi:hypothetical protein